MTFSTLEAKLNHGLFSPPQPYQPIQPLANLLPCQIAFGIDVEVGSASERMEIFLRRGSPERRLQEKARLPEVVLPLLRFMMSPFVLAREANHASCFFMGASPQTPGLASLVSL